MKTWILFALLFPLTATACIWDAQSLAHEKSRSHDLAQTILGEPQVLENTNQLRATLKDLEANRKEGDVNWWNNLAGTYLRLNQPLDAVKLLEPVVAKYPDDYGIHANLGTAYHLLGRYQDAEKEIARDLKINPEAHFGLEKYHLALLQYLERDAKYQFRHVYVNELTTAFLYSRHAGHFYTFKSIGRMIEVEAIDYTNNLAAAESDYEALVQTNRDESKIQDMLAVVAAVDPPPPYEAKWNLATNSNFEAGVIYMAQMNTKEPACFTMLGMAAWKKGDFHLAAAAFEKAIALGSPQSELLKKGATGFNDYIRKSRQNDPTVIFGGIGAVMAIPILYYIFSKFRDARKARRRAQVAVKI